MRAHGLDTLSVRAAFLIQTGNPLHRTHRDDNLRDHPPEMETPGRGFPGALQGLRPTAKTRQPVSGAFVSERTPHSMYIILSRLHPGNRGERRSASALTQLALPGRGQTTMCSKPRRLLRHQPLLELLELGYRQLRGFLTLQGGRLLNGLQPQSLHPSLRRLGQGGAS
jgi:hypothetical protein